MKIKNKILLFICSFIFFNISVTSIFYYYTDSYSLLIEFQNKVESEADSTKVLLIGDSHPTRGIGEINQVSKLTFYGQGPILCYYRLKSYLSKNINKPKYVFLQADITHYSRNYFYYRENNFFYIPLFDIENLLRHNVLSYKDYITLYAFKIFPYIEFRSLLKKNKLNKKKKDNIRYSDMSFKDQVRLADDFVLNKLLSNNPDYLYYDPSLYFLDKTIQLCIENDIEMIAVKYPVTSQYFNAISKLCDQDKINNPPQDEIFRKYEIPIWDFEKIYFDNNELFFDSHHMNLKGKTKFTELFKSKLNSENLIK